MCLILRLVDGEDFSLRCRQEQGMLKLLILLSFSAPLLADSDPLIQKYCLTDNGSVNPVAKTNVEKVSCSFGYKSIYFYEAWMQKDPELSEEKIKNFKLKRLKELRPNPMQDRLFTQAGASMFRNKYRKENSELDPDCKFSLNEKALMFMTCPGQPQKNLTVEFHTLMNNEEAQTMIFQGIYSNGKSVSETKKETRRPINKEKSITAVVKDSIETGPIAPISPDPLGGKAVELKGLTNKHLYTWQMFSPTPDMTFPVPTPLLKIYEPKAPVSSGLKIAATSDPTNEEGLVQPTNGEGLITQEASEVKLKEVEQEQPVQVKEEKEAKEEEVKIAEAPTLEECKEALQEALAEILKDDTKNIIGMQYELTVLKMAVLASESKGKTLESFIMSQSKAIQEADKEGNILSKVNATYRKYGLPEDQKALVEHLKQRASEAEYYKKEKRFYNQESSAFILAYRGLNPEAGFNDADVSVLWYMDKVNQKAVANSKGNKFSAQSNLTNLSTRVARYTADIKGLKSESKESLVSLVNQQKKKIDKEMEAVMEGFKQSNLACYKSIFGEAEGDRECNLEVLGEEFAQLLSVVSQIPSTDLISLDSSLKGNFTVVNKEKELITKFKIERVIKEEERSPASN